MRLFARSAAAYALLLFATIGPMSVQDSAAQDSAAQPPAAADKSVEAEFAKTLEDLISRHRGEVSVFIKHLETGVSYRRKADRPMPTASLIKLPIMAAAYQAVEKGELSLDKPITLKAEDKVPGSGVLTINFSAGVTMPLYDAIRLMIAYSDNTATNLVVDQIGLPATAEMMETLGLPNTKLHAKVYRRDTSIAPERSKEFGLGSTTAAEMIKLIEMLHAGELVSADASKAMREHMLACDDNTKVRRYLPAGAKTPNKTGAVSNSRTDAGVIESPAGPIGYCILTTGNADRSWGNENEAELLAAEIGRLAYAYFVNPTEAANAAPAARVLKVGDAGLLVEALQRTLNARTKPSPGIGVDGDFGPNTAGAVRAFQKQAGVEATGEVGPDTWRALGPLLTEDDPVDEPQVVNTKPIEKASPDVLAGPPTVTCRAYAIADATTGELLWGYEDGTRRDPASVTKIMTAVIVASLAEQDPSVLDETIVFSKAADDTSGSTSGVRVGEKVGVRDGLYGLMLPSGNDMSVALAEHFGERLAPAGFEGTSYDAFIEAMNEKAAQLGMSGTGYKNPHGLTAKGHHTTAGDMVKLARAALALPVLQEVVNTPVYGCTLDSVDGYQRNVVWRNTNRLLRIEGFYGLKTGTTGPAGACLVSAGKRGDADLIVVVLGSSCSDARYTDSRNLYRWAWSQLGAE
ncbi:MAG: serine hydrolase [Planctomycetota bacterium]